jgi:hypothetical protein
VAKVITATNKNRQFKLLLKFRQQGEGNKEVKFIFDQHEDKYGLKEG